MKQYLIGIAIGVFITLCAISAYTGPVGSRILFRLYWGDADQQMHRQTFYFNERAGVAEFRGPTGLEATPHEVIIKQERRFWPPWPVTVIEKIATGSDR